MFFSQYFVIVCFVLGWFCLGFLFVCLLGFWGFLCFVLLGKLFWRGGAGEYELLNRLPEDGR